MSSDVGRRAFVHNMVVGLPVLAGATSFPSLIYGSVNRPGHLLVAATADSRIDQVLRQMGDLHNDMRRRGPVVEDARTAASLLRTLAGYRQEAGRDGKLSLALRELIAENGLPSLTTPEPDFTHVRSALTQYGFDPQTLDFGSPTYRARVTALETLAREGISPSYFESASILVDAAASGKSLCQYLDEMMTMLEAMAAVFCIAALVFPPLEVECLAATAVLGLLKVINLLAQC